MKICKNFHIVLRNRAVYLLFGKNRRGIGLTWMPDHPLRVRIAVALLSAYMLYFAFFRLEPFLKFVGDAICSYFNLK